jgi:hypothetical protein
LSRLPDELPVDSLSVESSDLPVFSGAREFLETDRDYGNFH